MNSNNINKIISSLLLLCLLLLFAILLYNENREVFAWGEKEKCVVDPVIEDGFPEMERGKIPIGEAADEAELLAQMLIDEMEIIIDELPKEIEAGTILANLPEKCWCATDCESYMKVNEAACTCECVCSGSACPPDFIALIEQQVNIIKSSHAEIVKAAERIVNLILAENLLPDDPNRWQILNKLLNSRVKLEECITGYRIPLKEVMTKMRVLSCEIALDKIYLGELNILGYFEDKITPFPHCYPYYPSKTASYKRFIEENIQPICEKNKDSLECREAVRDFMDNYFCCEGE